MVPSSRKVRWLAMSKITVHGSLVRAILRTLVLASDANRGSRLASALEQLGYEVDQWALGNGLSVLVDNDKQTNLTVSDGLIRATTLCTARRFEAPQGTALRRSIDRLVRELDTWAIEGSTKQRRRSCVVLHKAGERR